MPRRVDVDTNTVRDRLGELVNQAQYRGDEFIIRRRGEPVAVLISYESYKNFQARRAQAFQVFQNIWNANRDVDPDQVEADVVEAIRQVRAAKRPAP